jgi:hypothetical protein
VNPLVFLGIYALVCVAAFAFGARFYRSAEPPEGVAGDQAKRFGRLLMMAATALAIIPVAAWLHGDLKLGLS